MRHVSIGYNLEFYIRLELLLNSTSFCIPNIVTFVANKYFVVHIYKYSVVVASHGYVLEVHMNEQTHVA